MNDQDRKDLTVWLGEEIPCRCDDCYGEKIHRTFTTPDDAHIVKKRLVELGEWTDFVRHLYRIVAWDMSNWTTVADVLTTPSLFCEKVLEYLKEKE